MKPLTLYAATGDAVARLDWPSDGAESTSTALSLEYRSDDGGATWTEASQTLPHKRVLSLTISPYERVRGKSVVYAGTEPSNLYRSEDDGATWQAFPAL
jgi:hypothetical protein